jgi:hypothetical protein
VADGRIPQRFTGPCRAPGGILVALLLACLAGPEAIAADASDRFLEAHKRALRHVRRRDWKRAVAVYRAFATVQSKDPGVPLARLREGTILAREMGRWPDARRAFAAAARTPDTEVGRAIRRVAFGWIARLQMAEIRAALRRYYTDKVEYPKTLQALVAAKVIAADLLTDPWGKPFLYRAGRLRIAPKLPRQSYALSCASLPGAKGSLATFLRASGAFERLWVFQAPVPGRPPAAMLSPEGKIGKSVRVAEGSRAGTARVLRITPQVVLLAEKDFLAVLVR